MGYGTKYFEESAHLCQVFGGLELGEEFRDPP